MNRLAALSKRIGRGIVSGISQRLVRVTLTISQALPHPPSKWAKYGHWWFFKIATPIYEWDWEHFGRMELGEQEPLAE